MFSKGFSPLIKFIIIFFDVFTRSSKRRQLFSQGKFHSFSSRNVNFILNVIFISDDEHRLNSDVAQIHVWFPRKSTCMFVVSEFSHLFTPTYDSRDLSRFFHFHWLSSGETQLGPRYVRANLAWRRDIRAPSVERLQKICWNFAGPLVLDRALQTINSWNNHVTAACRRAHVDVNK